MAILDDPDFHAEMRDDFARVSRAMATTHDRFHSDPFHDPCHSVCVLHPAGWNRCEDWAVWPWSSWDHENRQSGHPA